jgi:predicted nucleotidyltransferase
VRAEDDVIVRLVAEARRDTATVGLLLHGSRAVGSALADSDYDILWVLSEAGFEAREAQGGLLHVKEFRDRAALDIVYTSPSHLRFSVLRARVEVLFDKRGELEALVEDAGRIAADRVRDETAEFFDAYLNSFVRSVKAWQRGNELAGRLEAAESALCLVRALFALEGRIAPYAGRLHDELPALTGQGWEPGSIEEAILRLVSSGDAAFQQALVGRVETLMRARGFGHVIEAWGGDIERMKGLRMRNGHGRGLASAVSESGDAASP